jgi:hypothetical protein
MECFNCNAKGEVINEAWDREWDRHDRNSPSHYDTNLWMERSGIPKYEACPICNGTKKVEILSILSAQGKKLRSINLDTDGVHKYLLLEFEDQTFAKILYTDFTYVKGE